VEATTYQLRAIHPMARAEESALRCGSPEGRWTAIAGLPQVLGFLVPFELRVAEGAVRLGRRAWRDLLSGLRQLQLQAPHLLNKRVDNPRRRVWSRCAGSRAGVVGGGGGGGGGAGNIGRAVEEGGYRAIDASWRVSKRTWGERGGCVRRVGTGNRRNRGHVRWQGGLERPTARRYRRLERSRRVPAHFALRSQTGIAWEVPVAADFSLPTLLACQSRPPSPPVLERGSCRCGGYGGYGECGVCTRKQVRHHKSFNETIGLAMEFDTGPGRGEQ